MKFKFRIGWWYYFAVLFFFGACAFVTATALHAKNAALFLGVAAILLWALFFALILPVCWCSYCVLEEDHLFIRCGVFGPLAIPYADSSRCAKRTTRPPRWRRRSTGWKFSTEAAATAAATTA